ncbi:MAG: DUF5680 domain-containing protein [Desulforhabdus sp.]|jgi:hypothetical protein|nr:DUF5680 domain-containing protein [Desulforhabdus sp.]
MVAKQQIIDFLREAHINSWPDNIAPVDKPGLYGFEETHFSRGAWDFYDLYGGRVTDIGFEAIYFEKQPVWGAAYRGGVLSDEVDVTDIFDFLIAALRAPNDSEFPLRGPAVYRLDDDSQWLYQYQLSGDFFSFIGIEQILFDQGIVYERALIGGKFGSGLYGPAVPLFGEFLNGWKKADQENGGAL